MDDDDKSYISSYYAHCLPLGYTEFVVKVLAAVQIKITQ